MFHASTAAVCLVDTVKLEVAAPLTRCFAIAFDLSALAFVADDRSQQALWCRRLRRRVCAGSRARESMSMPVQVKALADIDSWYSTGSMRL